ncbi:type IV pili methyl-accepting chemotaxis transducer N-terminal domain-containing protein [Aliiroseovarius sp. 2305UL8-7]|uniref:type IV pili methyl-accepting chemotaxis transducer N-terminal domain-containing protein n=1 Tax=Aliiroseovarius conchicola TaxID=3121637 RepID=UPI0035274839
MNVKMSRRHFAVLMGATCAATSLSAVGGALAMAAGQVAHHINKADRMSMLTERTAKAVALIKLGVKVEEDFQQLQEAHDEFDDILLGFATGEGNSGIVKERVVVINNRLKKVEELWKPMRKAVEEIIADHKVDDAHFAAVEENDVALEKACHDVVRAIEEVYSGVDIDPGLAVAVDLAGRQRMLTQKLTKDVAFAALDYQVEEAHEDFRKNSTKFGKILDVLLTGGGGIMTIAEPPTAEAKSALEVTKAHWTSMADKVAELDAAKKPSAEQVAAFAEETEKLLVESDQVTEYYEAYVATLS